MHVLPLTQLGMRIGTAMIYLIGIGIWLVMATLVGLALGRAMARGAD
jgi:hypothetical protein